MVRHKYEKVDVVMKRGEDVGLNKAGDNKGEQKLIGVELVFTR